MKLHTVLLASILLLVPFTEGCSSRKSSTTTTTEVSGDGYETSRASYSDVGTVPVTRTETKTVETHTDHDHDHGGLFSIVGDIIALPFRAVGALLSAIF